ncbi:carbohydrate ABC transporter substrate-binding protein (CUT1 family) [Sinobaca qinghaiensis]|uniref:Carbohydrate ABC transporter substrate-binding protein (CUT1 family) n=1 Tax=Sinobaca qinghaiensis TaxID=342944 RepID=A0A419V8G5_9BACL|nr:sugar ABC transporter substrate-binding protein [Sinobaca qinghaiensis]RKD76404.1 carbohydrate ABC transporter substrate-binding protein (CUT1 family) [Sinobaca qinghaiensis]
MKLRVLVAGMVSTALLLSACGNEAESDGGDNEISLWVQTSSESPEGQAMQGSVEKFNEQFKGTYTANIEFIPRGGGGGGYEDKVNAAVSTGTLPDVLTLDGPNTAAYAESEIIAPLDGVISNTEDLLPSIVEQGTYEDEMYAVGYSESSVGIYYNKEMLEQAGVDLETLPTVDEPWTWDEFTQLSEKLTDYYEVPAIDMGLNDNSEWLMYAFSPFLWSQGGEITSEDGRQAETVFNSEANMKAMSFLQHMLNNDYTTISPAENGFETGQYPMKMSGSWTMEQLDTNYQDIDYDIMPYPVSPDTGELVTPTGSWQYAMSTATENEEGAGELIDFLTSTEAVVDISLANSVLPSRYSAIEEIEDDVSPQMNTLIEQNEASGKARPVLPEYPQITRSFQQTISGLPYYEDQAGLQELLDEKAKEMQTSLERRE